jgi:hypothetical protein
MRTQADWAYIQAYKEEVEAIRQQMMQVAEKNTYQLPALETAKGFVPKNNDRSFLVLQPGIINTYLASALSARA